MGKNSFLGICSLLFLLCGNTVVAETSNPKNPSAQSDHGESFPIGKVVILGKEFKIDRLGKLAPGAEGGFEVISSDDVNGISAYLWIESQDGKRLSAPSQSSFINGKAHFHVLPQKDSTPFRVVLRIRQGDKDERGSLPLSGHGHEHANSPHHGIQSPILSQSGELVGYLELKLHDDKGDLEIWLAKNEKMDIPFDLPLNSIIKAKFVDVQNKTVDLKVRNNQKNEDEAGSPNVRNGKTNYFIFPSSNEDSKWLMGKEFSSVVIIEFAGNNDHFISKEFLLVPHTHALGEEH